ncbi:MAG: hypothetical protein AB7N76_33275 [Planctomycetota bacterium]
MSDSERRLLARQLSPEVLEERGRLLNERLRSGGIELSRLLLAGYLGDEVARQVAGERLGEVPEEAGAWLAGARRFGTGPWLRAIGGVVRVDLEEGLRRSEDTLRLELAGAPPAFVRDSLERQAQRFQAALELFDQVLGPWLERPGEPLSLALEDAIAGWAELPAVTGLADLARQVGRLGLDVPPRRDDGRWAGEVGAVFARLERFGEEWVEHVARCEVGWAPHSPLRVRGAAQVRRNEAHARRLEAARSAAAASLRERVAADAERWALG